MLSKSKCNRCGSCCKDPVLTVEISADQAKFYSGFGLICQEKDGKYYTVIKIRQTCKHLSYDKMGKATCLVHENRPEICKKYPEGQVLFCKGCGYEKK